MKEECAGAVTSVFWNMDTCPVPPGFDGRRVGPCIKRYLEKLGYSGPLTMCAFGTLTDVPDEVLRAVLSTGFLLTIDAIGSNSLPSYLFPWKLDNPPPANIMVITHSTDRETCIDLDMAEHHQGYNIVRPYPLAPASSTNAECLWKSFILAESGALEEDYPIETVESAWVCDVCDELTGQGFEDLITHISSQEHAHKKSRCFPPAASDKDEDEEARVEPPWTYFPFQYAPRPRPSQGPHAYATPMSMHQPMPWESFPPHPHPHMLATPPSFCSRCATTILPKPWERFPPYPHMSATPSQFPRASITTYMSQTKPSELYPLMSATPSDSHGKDEREASSNV